MREVSAIYEAFLHARPSPLPDLAIQYGDYAVWQRGWLSGEVLERELAYWRERLAGAPALLELPVDRPRPPVESHRGAAFPFARAFRPGSVAVRTGLALVFVVTSVFLFSDRDVAPVFGHLSPLAGAQHR